MILQLPAWRILILGEDPLARAGLASLLDAQTRLEVLGHEVPDARLISVYQPDLLLLDLGWQAQRALSALPALVDEGLPLIVLLASANDAAMIAAALAQLDSYALLLRERSGQQIAAAANAILSGLLVIDPALRETLLNTEAAPEADLSELTPREREVLQALAQGLTNKAIALQLGITEHTVKFHVNAILSKLNAQSRTEAVSQALRRGWLPL